MDTWGGWCMETLVLAVLATWWCWTSKKGFRSLGEQYIFVIIVWYICSTYEICFLTFWNIFVQLTKYINFNGGTDRIGHTGNWLVVDSQKGLLHSRRSSNQGHLHVPTWNSFLSNLRKLAFDRKLEKIYWMKLGRQRFIEKVSLNDSKWWGVGLHPMWF